MADEDAKEKTGKKCSKCMVDKADAEKSREKKGAGSSEGYRQSQ